jgi:hypothetical protein
MDDEAQITALSRRSRGLPTARLQYQEATEQRLARERRRARTLKVMCLAQAAEWRRLLRRRLPSDG